MTLGASLGGLASARARPLPRARSELVRRGPAVLADGVERSEVFALARLALECAGRYCSNLERADTPRGLVAFTALASLSSRQI